MQRFIGEHLLVVDREHRITLKFGTNKKLKKTSRYFFLAQVIWAHGLLELILPFDLPGGPWLTLDCPAGIERIRRSGLVTANRARRSVGKSNLIQARIRRAQLQRNVTTEASTAE